MANAALDGHTRCDIATTPRWFHESRPSGGLTASSLPFLWYFSGIFPDRHANWPTFMSAAESPVLRFAGFELEPSERRLSRGGEVIPLTPKAFELLLLLIDGGGRVLSKADLMDALLAVARFDQLESNLNASMCGKLRARALDAKATATAVSKRCPSSDTASSPR